MAVIAPKPIVKPAPIVTKPVLPVATLYVQEAGDTAQISVADIHQGGLNDCFLMASIGEIALQSPNAIKNMIHVNGDGTETVTLYAAASGHLPGWGSGALHAISVAVDNKFAANGVNTAYSHGQATAPGLKETWPSVLEEAYAKAGGGYGSLAAGGSPVLAMEALTGQAASFLSQSQLAQGALSLAALRADIAGHDLITMDTHAAVSAYNLHADHCYMVEGLTKVGAADMVKLGNPWGTAAGDVPALVPLAKLATAFVEVDIGHLG